ncbi:DEAD-box helicase [Perkinsela sp. CCAP 1560/4]|nr:DEAD-box helicase [Perkinsela sp. CCAP 1560/4]|eukprot:KNH09641.1 DEAD-box helicase [Perkinsela sp. CCAP 1560/4]
MLRQYQPLERSHARFKGLVYRFARHGLIIPRKAKIYGSFFNPGKSASSSMLPEKVLKQATVNSQLLLGHEQQPSTYDTFDEYCVPQALRDVIARDFDAIAPTDIQRRTLSFLLRRESVALSSPSGTGKTLSYLLPIFMNMQKDRDVYKIPTRMSRPRAILLLPTRELCDQVYRNCAAFSEALDFQCTVYKGQARAKRAWNRMKKSQRLLMDVLVTTPRMVRTQVESRRLFLDDLRYIVVDEADVLISRGHQYIANQVLNKVRDRNLYEWLWPVQTQYIFVSSIVNTDLSNLLSNAFPRVHRISTPSLHKVPDTLKHRFVPFRSVYQKLDYLCYILQRAGYQKNAWNAPVTRVKSLTDDQSGNSEEQIVKSGESKTHAVVKHGTPHGTNRPGAFKTKRRVIIFFCKVETCTSVYYKLQSRGFPVAQLHSLLPLKDRAQVFRDWSDGKIPILCATDVLAIGIDNDIDVVINYTMPNHAVKYLRRAGRAGRANKQGLVISLFTKSQITIVRAMRQSILTKKPLQNISNWFANYKPTYKEWVQRKRNAVSKKLVRLILRQSVPQHLEKTYVAKRGTLQLPWHPKTIQYHGGIPERQHARIDDRRAHIAHEARKKILARKKKGSARFGHSKTHRFSKSFKNVETGYQGSDAPRIMEARRRGGNSITEKYGN